MGKVTLYGFNPSPPVRAVKLALAALGVEYEFVVVNIFNKEHLTEEFVKKNPTHTIPMLEDDGVCIWDSHAILAYLASKYGMDDSLYPKDLHKRAVVDQRLHFDTGVMFENTLRAVTKLVMFQGVTVVPKERLQAIHDAFGFIEAFLKEHDYVAGDKLTIADFSLISSISSVVAYLEIDPVKYPKLSAWVKRLEQLPYYSANSEGAQLFVANVKSKTFTFEE